MLLEGGLEEGCFWKEDWKEDASGRSGGHLAFVKSHLLTRQLTKLKILINIHIIIFELNLLKEKWLVVSIYKPSAQDATFFLNWLSQIIAFYSITYKRHVVIGDFNLTLDNKSMREFVDLLT